MTISEWRLKMSENNIAAKLKGIEGAADAASSGFNRFQDKMNSVKNNLIGAFSITAVAAMGKQIFSVGSEMEQLNVSFKTMLGSQAAATAMMEDIKKFSATTPFEMPEVAKASKQLLAFGIEQSKVIQSLRMLGDVGSGIGAPIGDLAYLFGTIKTQGRAMTMDINQFANRGIPIWDELSKITGKNSLQLRKFVEDGKIGFPQIEMAFANMSGAGGKFFNLMQEQSATSAGKLSNTMDKLKSVMDNLFIKAKPGIDNMIQKFGDLIDKIIPTVEWFQKNWEVIKKLTFAYIVYKASVLAVMAITKLNTWYTGLSTAAIIVNTLATEGLAAGWLAVKMAMSESMLLMTGGMMLALGGVALLINEVINKQKELDEILAKGAAKRANIAYDGELAHLEYTWEARQKKINFIKGKEASQLEDAKKSMLDFERNMLLEEEKKLRLRQGALGMPGRSRFEDLGLGTELSNLEKKKKAWEKFSGKNFKSNASDTGSAKPDPNFKAAADEISAGGKSVKNITVNIKTLNEGGINISTTKLPEAQSDIERQFMNWLLRAIQGAELAVANE